MHLALFIAYTKLEGYPISYRCGQQDKLPFKKSVACVRNESAILAPNLEFHKTLKETLMYLREKEGLG